MDIDAKGAIHMAASKAVTLQSANVRSGAGIFYNVIKTLNAGTDLDVLGKDLGWYRITAGSTTGYTYNTLIRIYDSAAAAGLPTVGTLAVHGFFAVFILGFFRIIVC